MKRAIIVFFAGILLLEFAIRQVNADLGSCQILFAYHARTPFTEKQQKDIGQRLLNAHGRSPESAEHIVFICETNEFNRSEHGEVYSIQETRIDMGSIAVKTFRLSAPGIEGLRHAVREIEAAAKERNTFSGLKSGLRKKIPSKPLMKSLKSIE